MASDDTTQVTVAPGELSVTAYGLYLTTKAYVSAVAGVTGEVYGEFSIKAKAADSASFCFAGNMNAVGFGFGYAQSQLYSVGKSVKVGLTSREYSILNVENDVQKIATSLLSVEDIKKKKKHKKEQLRIDFSLTELSAKTKELVEETTNITDSTTEIEGMLKYNVLAARRNTEAEATQTGEEVNEIVSNLLRDIISGVVDITTINSLNDMRTVLTERLAING